MPTLRERTEEALGDYSRELADLRARYVGRGGRIDLLLREMGDLPCDERRSVGDRLNEVVAVIEGRDAAPRG